MNELPIQVLISPFVIALVAVASMAVFSGARRVKEPKAVPVAVDGSDAVKMRLFCYMGGHPDVPNAFEAPVVVVTRAGLMVFDRRGRRLMATIAWERLDRWCIESLSEFEAAASTVRGLDRQVLAELPDDCQVVRFRYRDARDWWQNVAFALHGPDSSQQIAVLEAKAAMAPDVRGVRGSGPDSVV